MGSGGPDRLVVAAFAAFVVIIGSAPVAIRLGSFELPPLWAAGLRFGVSGVILVGLAIAWRVPFPRGANLVGAVLFGLLLYGGSIPLAYIGLTQAPAAMASISDAFLPLEALLIAAAIGLERVRPRGLAGALVAVAGVAVIVSNQLGSAVPPLALGALGGSTLCTALLLVLLKRLPPGHPTSANAVAMAVGTPILLGLSALAHEPWALPGRTDSWVSFAFLVFGATVVGYQLGLFVVARWTASASSYAFLLAPLVAVVVAAIVLAEPIRDHDRGRRADRRRHLAGRLQRAVGVNAQAGAGRTVSRRRQGGPRQTQSDHSVGCDRPWGPIAGDLIDQQRMLRTERLLDPDEPPRGGSMSFTEEATSPAVAARSEMVGRQTPRSIRETGLYAASLGLFGVLAGLALITPLNAFADDILDDPLGGNWSARFLALGLLAATGFALHALTANMGGKTLVGGSSERHSSLPGVRWFKGYHTALTDMWTGAVLVVFLIILAAAIPRGVTVFLSAYIAYLAWTGLLSIVYLVRNRAWARSALGTAANPVALLRQVESDRHVPAFPDDIEESNRGDNVDVELMYTREFAFVIWETSVLIVWSALLWLVASTSPGLAAAVSLVWFITVVTDIVLSYLLFPQAFAM